jgi:type IV pilus assembly protein PilE
MKTELSRRGVIQYGFTLVEVMIVVAIIGILAAIAFPAYTESVAKGRRSKATSQLMQAQQWMERFYSENYAYDKDTTNASPVTRFNVSFATVPPPGESATAYYNISLSNLTATTYTIRAVRATSMANDACGDMTIDNLGKKDFVSGTYDSSRFATAADAKATCWK